MRPRLFPWLLLLSSCGSYIASTPTADPSGEGREAFLVTCDNLATCQERAEHLCAGGYSVSATGADNGRDTVSEVVDILSPGNKNPKRPTRSQMVVSCRSETEEAPRGSVTARPTIEREAPSGAAGIVLGAPLKQVQNACESAGFTWTESPAVARCSGLPEDVGVSGYATVVPCEGSVCSVSLVVPAGTPGDKQWATRFSHLRKALEARYGEATAHDTGRLAGCKGDLGSCLDDPSARVALGWSFPAGSEVQLIARADPPRGPVVTLTYTSAEKAKRERSKGL